MTAQDLMQVGLLLLAAAGAGVLLAVAVVALLDRKPRREARERASARRSPRPAACPRGMRFPAWDARPLLGLRRARAEREDTRVAAGRAVDR